MQQTENQKQAIEIIKSACEESGYTVRHIGNDIEISGKVILPSLRRMLEHVGTITYSSYRLVSATINRKELLN